MTEGTGLDWFKLAQQGGAVIAPFLLAAIFFLNAERVRLLTELRDQQRKVELLAERVITLVAEIKTFLFNERRGS